MESTRLDDDEATGVAEPEHTPRASERTSWPKVLAAPWYGIIRPRAAVAWMVAASQTAFWIGFSLAALCIGVCVALLVLWAAGFAVIASEPIGPEQTDALAVGQEVEQVHNVTIWTAWYADAWFQTFKFTTLGVALGIMALAAFGAWLFLPELHVRGSGSESYARTFRAVAAETGMLAILTALLGLVIAAAVRAANAGNFGGLVSGMQPALAVTILVAGGGACLIILIARVGHAVRYARGADHQPTLPPICEGCGYNLTHRSSDGVCSECGLSLEQSLTAGRRRNTSDWECSGSRKDWFGTSLQAIFSPRRFYGGIKVGSFEKSPVVFAGEHYALMGITAALWALLVAPPNLSGRTGPTVAIPVFLLFWIPLAGWGVHRLVAAFAASGCIARHELLDFTRFRKVLVYETPFAWVFCLFNGGLISSFMWFGGWMSRIFGERIFIPVLGAPLEFGVLFCGNAALMLIWLRRFRIALRGVRWANF
ncbi:MAG: hypothetical protein IH986_18855 [Planctomycetes bacterium]|nr:hypothetical protein [Planctomycetota bacterium]